MSLNIDVVRLPVSIQEKTKKFISDFLEIHGDNVLSVFVYGSATGKSFIPNVSDVNIGVVLRSNNFCVLKKSLGVIEKGMKNKIPAPLFLTIEYIKSSLDVFPVEFLEMKENNMCVYGSDFLAGMEINTEHTRLFCEQQIKGKLIRIKQAYLESGTKGVLTERILGESLNSLIPIFRSLLRLKNENPYFEKDKLLGQFCRVFGLDEKVFIEILNYKSGGGKTPRTDVESIMECYLSELEKLAVLVD